MIGNWDGIEEFVAVAQAGSFTAAAQSFGASVTHMSRSIARLEARVQAQLFYRTTRSIRLTETGQPFFERCQRIVEERDEALAEISSAKEARGHLRVTCSYTLGERFVAPLIRQFAHAHPALTITIDLNNEIVDVVTDGFDLALRTGHLADSRLIATRIATRTLRTAASPGYLTARGTPETPDMLRRHDCLVGSSPHWQFSGGRRFRPKGRWRCNSGWTVVEAAVDGLGICQLPDFYLSDRLESGTLRAILEPFQPAPEPVWAVYPRHRHLLPKVSRLVEFLKGRLPLELEGQALSNERGH